VWNSNTAEVEVEPDSDAAVRLGKRRGTEAARPGVLRLHYSDLNIVADELAGYGPEVLVLGPPELRNAVIARLGTIAEAHGDREENRG